MFKGLKKQDERALTGFIWLRIGTSGGLVNKVMNTQDP